MTRDAHLQDRVKRLYQQCFGGGHMIADPDASLARLEAECGALTPGKMTVPLFEPIGNGQCRLHLRPLLKTGLSLKTTNALFVYSANHTRADQAGFDASLDTLAQNDAERRWIAEYRKNGCPPIGHSDEYRMRFTPAYRVIHQSFMDVFPLVLAMDRLKSGVIAIDGPCTAGKSTLAQRLSEVFVAGLIHMDDFFLRPSQRTAARLAEPGGNIDRERFLSEVLIPLRSGVPFAYRPYDCSSGELVGPVPFTPSPLTIIEGVYSMHPDLRSMYDISVFLDIEPDVQQTRLLARNGAAMLKRFNAEWIPLENKYFCALQIREACTFHFDRSS